MEIVNAWGPVLASTAVTISLVVLLWRLIDARFSDFEKRMDEKLAAMDGRFAGVDEKFAAMDRRMDERFTAMDRRMDEKFAASDRLLDERFGAVDHRLSALETDLTIIKQHLLNPSAA